MQFGCFVQLEGLRGRHEGLVHVSQVKIVITCHYAMKSIGNVRIECGLTCYAIQYVYSVGG